MLKIFCKISQSSSLTGAAFSGSGWGHNVGMSQWGAYAMAQKGFTAEEIIRFYYTGVTVDYYDPN